MKCESRSVAFQAIFPVRLKAFSLTLFVVVCTMVGVTNTVKAETLSVPFSRGFIGTVGSNPGQADSIYTFSTLEVVRAYFVQESNSSQFGGTQGNDYSGVVRLLLPDGSTLDVPGAINWRDGANPVHAIGFIPDPAYAGATISYGSGSTYTVDATSNFGLQLNSSTRTYLDGTDISGNAATSGLLDALNGYLLLTQTSAPSGPVTVTSQTTTDTTPVVSGTVTLQAGESLVVEINGQTYTTASGLTVNSSAGTWEITIPSGDALAIAVYDVTATIIDSDGYVLEDSTSGELTITGTDPALTLTKTASRSGDVITYTYVVENTGDTTLNDVTVSEDSTGFSGTGTLPAPELAADPLTDNGTTGDSSNTADDGDYDILAPGDAVTFTASYTLTQADIDAGTLSNSAIGEATAPGDTPVSDTSDDGDDTDGNTTDDPTELNVGGTAGIKVTDLDLAATEQGNEAAMQFVLETLPTGPVTLTFAGDGQCSVAPEVMTFTTGDWDVAQTLTITALNDDVAEGDHSCQPSITVSSADPGYNGLQPALSTVAIAEDLIDQIRDELTEILEDDLEETANRLSDQFSGISRGALSRLKEGMHEGRRCGSLDEFDVDGAAELSGANLTSEGTFGEDFYDCLENERRIVDGQFSLAYREDFGHQAAVSVTFLRERFASEDSMKGRFFGGYLSSSTVDAAGEGTISGIGVNAGLYGARRIEEALYLDYYLAAAAGHHRFDLSFGADAPILADGHYNYAAAFAGFAVSGEKHFDSFDLAPRVGLDLGYAAAGDAKVTATQLDTVENGSIDLADVSGVSAFAELIFTRDWTQVANGRNSTRTSRELAPRGFCEKSFGNAKAQCGLGGYISWSRENEAGDIAKGVRFDFEATEQRQRASVDLYHIRSLARGAGKAVTRIGSDLTGALSFHQQVQLSF